MITRTVFEAAADLGHFFFVLLIFFFCFTMARARRPRLPARRFMFLSPPRLPPPVTHGKRSHCQQLILFSRNLPRRMQIAHLMFGFYVAWFADLPTAINTSFTTILGDFSWFPTIESPPGSQGILGAGAVRLPDCGAELESGSVRFLSGD